MNITIEEAKNIVDNLNSEFNVKPCRVIVKPNLEYGKSAYYYGLYDSIFVSEKDLKEWVIIHEYAHHLDHIISVTKREIIQDRKSIRIRQKRLKDMDFGYSKRLACVNAPIRRRKIRKKKRIEHHGKSFIKALKMVATKHYGSVEGYKPDREYSRVKKALRIKEGGI